MASSCGGAFNHKLICLLLKHTHKVQNFSTRLMLLGVWAHLLSTQSTQRGPPYYRYAGYYREERPPSGEHIQAHRIRDIIFVRLCICVCVCLISYTKLINYRRPTFSILPPTLQIFAHTHARNVVGWHRKQPTAKH